MKDLVDFKFVVLPLFWCGSCKLLVQLSVAVNFDDGKYLSG
jgi:hypothetical protein